MYILTNENLEDLNKKGKDRAWAERKNKADKIAKIMTKAKSLKERAVNMSNCADILTFKECINCGEKHLKHAFFCKDRFCPVCSWRRSLKLFNNHLAIYKEVNTKFENATHYMLTLTVQNCDLLQLKNTINLLNKSWDRFSRRVLISKNFEGYLKVLEITRNTKKSSSWYKTMHPHLHVILTTTDKEKNIDIEEIKANWLDCLQVEDINLYNHYKQYLQVEFHKIENIENTDFEKKNVKSHNISTNAIAEISKYSMKYQDLFCKDETIQEKAKFLEILSEQIKNTKNISYGGIIKNIAKALMIEEKEENLVNINEHSSKDEFCEKCNNKMIETSYKYDRENKIYRKILYAEKIIFENEIFFVDKTTGEILKEITA